MKTHATTACFVVLLGFSIGTVGDERTSAPWRENDATIIELCFDGLDRSAPEQLRAEEVTDISVGNVQAELVGFTLTDRPIYRVGAAHPVKFRSLLLQLPNSNIVTKIDRPDFIKSVINAARYAPTPTVCTDDDRAGLRLVRGEKLSNTVDCPDLGLTVGFRVISSTEYGATRALDKQRGLKVFNGLRGCREFVYR